MKKKPTHGGKRAGSGAPTHKLGKGVKVSLLIPGRLHEALRRDTELDEVNMSQAIVSRLIRGKRRGREL